MEYINEKVTIPKEAERIVCKGIQEENGAGKKELNQKMENMVKECLHQNIFLQS